MELNVANYKSVRPFKNLQPSLGARVYIDDSAVVIGDVSLGNDVSVWPFAVIRGDMHRIAVGARTSVQDNAVLHITHTSTFNPGGWPLTIGEDVTIGHGACLHGCTVGNRVLIGIGATVLDGAIIGDDIVIGAGTLVPPGKHLESGYLYVGSPCRQARTLKESELAYFTYSAQNYVKLKDAYLLESEDFG
ncbi:MAG: carbonic anhydrase/acetyltransferase-like protein (isoleucine patch superfamily) [Lentisphaeria bacterium]